MRNEEIKKELDTIKLQLTNLETLVNILLARFPAPVPPPYEPPTKPPEPFPPYTNPDPRPWTNPWEGTPYWLSDGTKTTSGGGP